MDAPVRYVVGCMSGTSLDGLDAALVRLEGRGLDIRPRFIRGASRPIGPAAAGLRALATGAALTAGEIASLSLAFAESHADVVDELLPHAPGGRVDLVAVHGQTVHHAPPASWQLLNPWPISRRARCPVVFDLRGADLAAGGQGAPITPIFDWLAFRDPFEDVAVVNLGGFCNLTHLPAGGGVEAVRGADVCACNHILDAVARAALNASFDEDGHAALAGTSHPTAEGELRSLLERQGAGGRSLGSGDEAAAWVRAWLGRLSPNDLARTAAEGVGAVIGGACTKLGCTRVLLAGGGARNAALVGAIGRALGACDGAGERGRRGTRHAGGDGHGEVRVRPTDDLGVPGAYREATAMGVLGALCRDGVPITLPEVTGCGSEDGPTRAAPLSGCWTNAG